MGKNRIFPVAQKDFVSLFSGQRNDNKNTFTQTITILTTTTSKRFSPAPVSIWWQFLRPFWLVLGRKRLLFWNREETRDFPPGTFRAKRGRWKQKLITSLKKNKKSWTIQLCNDHSFSWSSSSEFSLNEEMFALKQAASTCRCCPTVGWRRRSQRAKLDIDSRRGQYLQKKTWPIKTTVKDRADRK